MPNPGFFPPPGPEAFAMQAMMMPQQEQMMQMQLMMQQMAQMEQAMQNGGAPAQVSLNVYAFQVLY
jgi:preprotein translocase subunit YajC